MALCQFPGKARLVRLFGVKSKESKLKPFSFKALVAPLLRVVDEYEGMSPAETAAYRAEQMRLLVASTRAYPYVLPPIYGAVAYIFYQMAPSSVPLIWFGIGLILVTVTAVWLRQYQGLDQSRKESARSFNQIATLHSAMTWYVVSMAIWGWSPENDITNMLVISLMIASMLIRTATLNASLKVFYIAAVPNAFVLLLRPLAEGGDFYISVGIMATFGVLMMFIVAHRLNQFVRDNVILRTTKDTLIENLRVHDEELRGNHDYLSTVLDSVAQGISVWDKDLTLTGWNGGFAKILSLPEGWVKKGRTMDEFVCFCDERGDYSSEESDEMLADARSENRIRQHQYESALASGKTLEVQASPMPDGGFVLTYQEITERKLAERLLGESTEEISRQLSTLQEHKERLEQRAAEAEAMTSDLIAARSEAEDGMTRIKSVFDTAADGLITISAGGLIDAFNPAAERMFGFSSDEIVGKNVSALMPEPQRSDHDEHLRRYLTGSPARQPGEFLEFEAANKDGKTFPIELSVAQMNIGGETMFTGVIRDISERKKAAAAIKRMALNDALTGLPNRNLFQRRLSDAVKNARRLKRLVGVVMLDIDNFKPINDIFGHPVGDKLLKIIGLRLNESLREVDTVARLGGDEFALIMTNMDTTDNVNIPMQRILNVISEPIELDGERHQVSTSIGITFFPDDADDPDELIRKAEVALYKAKEAGGSQYLLFDEEMDASARARRDTEEGIKVGLERGEFELYYQPLIDMVHETVMGAEALMRWNHPERGLVPPYEFIEIAEASGQIVPMGEWALRTACRQAREWRAQGLPEFRVAVNISPRQFLNDNLVDCVKSALNDADLDPSLLELEINEGMVMSDTEDVIGKLQALRDLGVQLAIDDFGTGYSSLSYLKKLPVDRLKIDQSFIRDIDTDKDDASITEAIINLGQSLKLAVIAEGVETVEHVRHLLRKGCSEGQGYYYSRPVPTDDFVAWCKNYIAENTPAKPKKKKPARKRAGASGK